MKQRAPVIAALALLMAAPLAGAWLTGFPAGFYDFPPLVHNRPEMPGFTWPIFTLFALLAVATLLLLIFPSMAKMGGLRKAKPQVDRCGLPLWGWVGLTLTGASWICAWGQFKWLGPLAEHTFFPLWLGYILSMDGWVYRRRGHSMLSEAPGRFLVLFPASALSWWYFEFLNRLVQNWWYEGAFEFSAVRYVAHATICFSTVLPAVFETSDWLSTHRWFREAYTEGPRIAQPQTRTSVLLMVFGTLGLVGLVCFPAPTFYLVWLAPLSLVLGALGLAGVTTPLGRIDKGDYGRVVSLAVAALVCGFFWEMWNFWSMPKWNYSVPYVQAFHLFEMPAVGYAGYLPFGPYCWCFWLCLEVLAGSHRKAVL